MSDWLGKWFARSLTNEKRPPKGSLSDPLKLVLLELTRRIVLAVGLAVFVDILGFVFLSRLAGSVVTTVRATIVVAIDAAMAVFLCLF